MDTWGLLGQALECSVCLEQLDSTSRVLPCQHTFCRKCLIDIINSRKELRCPECRVLVTVPFNSLPPNILLLRILEGIKKFPPNTSDTAAASISENLLDVSSQSNSQLNKDSDPFSIFSQFSASKEPSIQTSSNRDLINSERSIHTSTNPFLEPHSNAYASVTNQVVPSLNNCAQNNSIISNIDSLSYTTAEIDSSLNVLSPLQSSSSQENPRDQLLANKSCPSAQIISSVLSSSHTLNNLARQNINLNSDSNSHSLEHNISLSSSSQAVSPSINPTPVLKPLSDYISAGRTTVNTLTQCEPNDSVVESQSIETSKSSHIIKIKSEESSVVNVRTSLGSHLPSKSLRESQLTSISSQPFVSLSLNVQAKALYNYNGKEARDLKFKKGDVIKLFKQIDENWYQGELEGQVGIVPASYVKFIEPTSSHIPQCKALYDFKMPMEEERNCLMFSKGDMITILRRVDENWAEGKLNTLIGIFPLSFVELNEAAKNLIRISSRLSGTQTSTNASPSRSSSVSSDCLKRTESTRLHSQMENDVTRSLPTLQLYVALYSYRPRGADELELTKGFLYSVADKCLDGWFKGRCLATDKIGVFPGNYVQIANAEAIAGAHYPKSMTASIANYLSEIHGINFAGGNNKFKTSISPRTHSQTGSLGDVRNLSIGVACPPELPPRSLTSSSKNIGSTSTGERVTEDKSCNGVAKTVKQMPAPLMRERYRCVTPYPANSEYELELQVGDIVYIHKKRDDGWFKGTLQRTGKTGLFPSIFVELC